MRNTLKMEASKHPVMRRTIILTMLALNFLLVVQDIFIEPIRLNVFDYIAFNFFMCFFFLLVGSLFLIAHSFKHNDSALQLQLRSGRLRLGVLAGLLSAFSMVTLMQGALIFEFNKRANAGTMPLTEISDVPNLLLVFLVFFLYGILFYYLLVIFFGFLFRQMFRSIRG